MKKIMALILACILALSLCAGCNDTAGGAPTEKIPEAGTTPGAQDEKEPQDGDGPKEGSPDDVTLTGPVDQAEEQTEGTIYAFVLMDNERIFKGEETSAVAIAESYQLNLADNKLALVQCVQASDTEWEMYVLNMDSISSWFNESYQNIAKEQFYKWLRGEDDGDDGQDGGSPGGSHGPPADGQDGGSPGGSNGPPKG